jgi:hypothetical protein
MNLTLEGIKKKPETGGDKDLLYEVLRYIRDFKRVDKIVRCYKKHTKESIQTLKKFDFRKGEDPTKDESTLDKYLEEIESTYLKWTNLGQEIVKIENDINTLKKSVGNTIMDQSRNFKKELIEFKQRYEFEAPFNWNEEVDDNEMARAYNKIDELAKKL